MILRLGFESAARSKSADSKIVHCMRKHNLTGLNFHQLDTCLLIRVNLTCDYYFRPTGLLVIGNA
jgi:hypothetical protein